MKSTKGKFVDRLNLRSKFLLVLIPLIAVSLLISTVLGMHYIKTSTQSALQESMEQTVGIAADRVADYIANKKALALAMASRIGVLYEEEITGPYVRSTAGEFEQRVLAMKDTYGFLHMYIVDSSGYARTEQHTNIAAMDLAFYNAVTRDGAEVFMTEPEIDTNKFAGEYVITFAVPISNENNENIGVLVCKTRASLICDMVNEIMVGDGGSTFIMDNDMRCIAHRNPEMLYGGSLFIATLNNPEYKTLNALWQQMHDEEKGFMTYEYEGTRLAAFDTVKGTNNWTLAVTASDVNTPYGQNPKRP